MNLAEFFNHYRSHSAEQSAKMDQLLFVFEGTLPPMLQNMNDAVTALQKAVADLQAAQPAITALQGQVATLTQQKADLTAALAAAQAQGVSQDTLNSIQGVVDQIEQVAQANQNLTNALPTSPPADPA